MSGPMECRCPLAGYCETYGRVMGQGDRDRCAASQQFRDLFARLPAKPCLAEKAGNAVRAAGRAVAAVATGKPLFVPADVLRERQAACAACPKDADGWCQACGCNLAAKQRLATESCPLGRWPQSAGDTPAAAT